MLVRGHLHGNVLPARFEDLGKGEVNVLSRAKCGKLFNVPAEEFIAFFDFVSGDDAELALWVKLGGGLTFGVE